MSQAALHQLSDAELVEATRSLVVAGRRVTAKLILDLAEVEERRLHLRAASPLSSTFARAASA
ncbi:MAG: hypothetical protein IPI67_05195 [Myxococcales bacterium]|nr:hypothetical protein [Myxococcales bacterium]